MEVLLEYRAEVAELSAKLDEIKRKMGMVDDAADKSAKKTTKSFQEASGKVHSSLSGMIGKLGEVGAAIGIAFGVSQLIAFGKASVEAFAESERASKQLLFALNGNAAAHERLIHQAETLQNTTPFEDDAIVAAQSYLAAQNRTEEQIRKTIAAAVDLSTVTGQDLQSAVEQLNATYEGNIGRLGKQNSELKKLTQSQLENGGAVDILGAKYKGFAEKDLDTTAGKLAQLKNFFNDFQEDVGNALATAFVSWKRTIEGEMEWFNKHIYDFRSGPTMTGLEKQLSMMEGSIIRAKSLLKKSDQEIAQASGGKSRAEVQDLLNKKVKEYIDLGGDAAKITLQGEKVNQQASKRTIESLQAEIDRKKEDMSQEEIGSAKQKQLLKDMTKLEADLAHAKGEQTQAEKDAEQKRQQAAEKKKQDDAEEIKRIDAIKKANLEATVEAYKATQDARNQELIDLDSKARKMQEDGVKQNTIDEYTRVQEKAINDKYDKIEADASQKRQDEMLADLEKMVDADEAAEKQKTENTKKQLDERKEQYAKYIEAVGTAGNALFDLLASLRQNESQEIDAKQKEELAKLDQQFGIKEKQETEYEKQKRLVQEKYDKERAEVKRKEAVADRNKAAFNIAIQTAENVVKAFPNPVTIGLAIALGAIEEAAVLSRKIPEFARGVIGFKGEGTETSDSNLVKISKGESIITAKATKQYSPFLEAMNRGKFEEMLTNNTLINMAHSADRKKEQLSTSEKRELQKVLKAQLDDTNMLHALQQPHGLKRRDMDYLAGEIIRGFNSKRRTR